MQHKDVTVEVVIFSVINQKAEVLVFSLAPGQTKVAGSVGGRAVVERCLSGLEQCLRHLIVAITWIALAALTPSLERPCDSGSMAPESERVR